LLVRCAAFKKDQKQNYSTEAARAKLFASETAMEMTVKAYSFMVAMAILENILLRE
jgi:butyryl-CoA dehydrogenase